MVRYSSWRPLINEYVEVLPYIILKREKEKTPNILGISGVMACILKNLRNCVGYCTLIAVPVGGENLQPFV